MIKISRQWPNNAATPIGRKENSLGINIISSKEIDQEPENYSSYHIQK